MVLPDREQSGVDTRTCGCHTMPTFSGLSADLPETKMNAQEFQARLDAYNAKLAEITPRIAELEKACDWDSLEYMVLVAMQSGLMEARDREFNEYYQAKEEGLTQ